MKEIFELRRVTDLSISLSNSPTDAHTLLIDPLHGVELREAYLSSAICLCLVGGLLPSDWFVSQAASLPIGSLGGILSLTDWSRPCFYFLIFLIPIAAPSAVARAH